MENKDLEQELKKRAENIEVKDFSVIWENIKDREPVVYRERKPISRWLPVIASASCIALVCVVAIPVVLSLNQPDAPPMDYFSKQLISETLAVNEIYEQLDEAKIDCVDLTRFNGTTGLILKTEQHIVKGALIELTDDLNNPTFYLSLRLYSDDVKVTDVVVVYDFSYSVNGATIEYRVKEAYPEDSVYIYDIQANYNAVNYYIEYTCFTEDITPFLNEFFQ